MPNVPNPFKLIDDALLDYVFNPLMWKIEYHYGRNAMDVRMFLTYFSILWLLPVELFLQQYVTAVILIVAWVWFWFRLDDMVRSSWRNGNRTGKNIVRISGFWIRRINDLLFLAIVFSHASYDLVTVVWLVVGWLILLIITGYLDATDALPPHYRELKTAPQT